MSKWPGGTGPTSSSSRGAYNIYPALSTPVVGSNIIYSSHPYTDDTCANGSPTTLPSDIDSVVKRVTTVYPVIFSEFGRDCTSTTSPDPFVKLVVDYAEQNHMGWIVYDWVKTDNDVQNNQSNLCSPVNGTQQLKCEYSIFWETSTDWAGRIPWAANPRGIYVLQTLTARPSSLN